jgi:EAL domain-containing protein (putative c-di-GMP-specific phosphodiesterase class I)
MKDDTNEHSRHGNESLTQSGEFVSARKPTPPHSLSSAQKVQTAVPATAEYRAHDTHEPQTSEYKAVKKSDPQTGEYGAADSPPAQATKRTRSQVQSDEYDKVLARTSTMELRLNHPPSTLDLPSRVIDPVTDMTSLTSLHQELSTVLDAGKRITVFYVHLPNSSIVEERYGWKTSAAYLGAAADYLRKAATKLRKARLVASLNSAFGDDFVLTCPQSEQDETFGEELTAGLERHLVRTHSKFLSADNVYVGMSSFQQLPRLNRERLMYRAIRQAQQQAMDAGRFILQRQARLLDQSLKDDTFYLVFQPIVRLDNNKIYGQEALVRSNKAELANPYVLLDIAEKTNRNHALGRHLRKLALASLGELPWDQLLFMNVHGMDLDDPEITDPPEALRMVGDRVILEITERTAISDFNVVRTGLQKLRNMGFRVAIDDLGSGYSTLTSVAQIEPEIIKFDMLLVRSIDQSRLRQKLLYQLIEFAKSIGCEIVAEGIETKAELETVKRLGCHLGQGFYLARPSEKARSKI